MASTNLATKAKINGCKIFAGVRRENIVFIQLAESRTPSVISGVSWVSMGSRGLQWGFKCIQKSFRGIQEDSGSFKVFQGAFHCSQKSLRKASGAQKYSENFREAPTTRIQAIL